MPKSVAPGVNSSPGPPREAQRLQRPVEHPGLDEEEHPAVEADVLRHEERKDEEQADEPRPAPEHPREPVGDRIGDHREDGDGRGRERQRPDERGPDRVRRVEDRRIVRQREGPEGVEAARRREGEADHGEERRDEAGRQQHIDRDGAEAPAERSRRWRPRRAGPFIAMSEAAIAQPSTKMRVGAVPADQHRRVEGRSRPARRGTARRRAACRRRAPGTAGASRASRSCRARPRSRSRPPRRPTSRRRNSGRTTMKPRRAPPPGTRKLPGTSSLLEEPVRHGAAPETRSPRP